MSILTKEEREGIRRRYQAESIADASVIRTLLDTIDAMERTIKGIERATSMHQVETCLIAARAFGIIEEDEE